MTLPSPTASKTCETCGKAMERHRYPSGKREPPCAFAKRRYCGRKCAGAYVPASRRRGGRPLTYPEGRVIPQGFAIRPEVRARLMEIARQQGTNMSAVLRDIFDRWMEASR